MIGNKFCRNSLATILAVRSTTRYSRFILFVVLTIAFLTNVDAKKKNYGGAGGKKVHWKKENECAKTTCKHLNSDENDDCLAKCVSETCHTEVYASAPLEP